jgi:hypothetical protein
MLRKISVVAALAATLAMPAFTYAKGGGGGHMGGHLATGQMGMRHMGHMGPVAGGRSFARLGDMHTSGRMGRMHSVGPVRGDRDFRRGEFSRHFDRDDLHRHFDRDDFSRHAAFRHDRFRHGRFFVVGFGYHYGDYCYRPVWTPWGWQRRWVCNYYDYDAY